MAARIESRLWSIEDAFALLTNGTQAKHRVSRIGSSTNAKITLRRG
jgi:hypothetical protein